MEVIGAIGARLAGDPGLPVEHILNVNYNRGWLTQAWFSAAGWSCTESSCRYFMFSCHLRLDVHHHSQPGNFITAGPSTPQVIALR